MSRTRSDIAVVGVTLAAVAPMMAAFRGLPAGEVWRVRNHLDEGLQAKVAAEGGVTHASLYRMTGILERAVEDGADAVLLTCTVFSPHVAMFRRFFPVPIVAADLAMLDAAAKLARPTAILCSFPATLGTSLEMFEAAARAAGLPAEGEVYLVEGALDALADGDRTRHDDLVEARVRALSPRFGAIVLAQMSMAGAADRLTDLAVPVLTSPGCAVAAVRAALADRAPPA
jgi:Asp/Glu/hydantoin racemase